METELTVPPGTEHPAAIGEQDRQPDIILTGKLGE
jgi:hypothetical protein